VFLNYEKVQKIKLNLLNRYSLLYFLLYINVGMEINKSKINRIYKFGLEKFLSNK